jgi:membrane protein implicated in regulation of membrane protease activity
VRWLADLVGKVRSWPLIPRLMFQAWWLIALIVGVDVIFGFGLMEGAPSWLTGICFLPFALIFFLMIADRVRRIASAISGAFSRG